MRYLRRSSLCFHDHSLRWLAQSGDWMSLIWWNDLLYCLVSNWMYTFFMLTGGLVTPTWLYTPWRQQKTVYVLTSWFWNNFKFTEIEPGQGTPMYPLPSWIVNILSHLLHHSSFFLSHIYILYLYLCVYRHIYRQRSLLYLDRDNYIQGARIIIIIITAIWAI